MQLRTNEPRLATVYFLLTSVAIVNSLWFFVHTIMPKDKQWHEQSAAGADWTTMPALSCPLQIVPSLRLRMDILYTCEDRRYQLVFGQLVITALKLTTGPRSEL